MASPITPTEQLLARIADDLSAIRAAVAPKDSGKARPAKPASRKAPAKKSSTKTVTGQ